MADYLVLTRTTQEPTDKQNRSQNENNNIIIRICVLFIALSCYTLIFKTGHDNAVQKSAWTAKHWLNERKREE